jgi:YD repeat-containing protein
MAMEQDKAAREQQQAEVDRARQEQEEMMKAEIEREKIAHAERMKQAELASAKEIREMELAWERQHVGDDRQFERDKASLPTREHFDQSMQAQSAMLGETLMTIQTAMADMLQQMQEQVRVLSLKVDEMATELASPIEFSRGQDGRVTAISKGSRTMRVDRDKSGRMVGVN